MRKALASVVVIVFAALLCTSLLTMFTGKTVNHTHYVRSSALEYPYHIPSE